MTTDDLHIPHAILDIANRLSEAGFEAYLVGGSVRDLLRGVNPTDWDITTDGRPDDMLDIFDHAHYKNDFGTVRVVNDEIEDPELKTVEITTYRTETGYSDSRHPDEVKFSDSIDEDLSRRDFTINALALDLKEIPKSGELVVSPETIVDNHGGLVDLQKRVLRTVGDPAERLSEDALRIMRGIRFATVMQLEFEANTKAQMEKLSSRLNDIAVERIRDEFVKIIDSDDPKLGLEILQKMGALPVFIPELSDTIDLEQNQAHSYDLWEHLTRACQTAADKDWPTFIRLAALFHDIAKPHTREWSDKRDDWSFHNHEVVGARVTKKIMERLKFPTDLVSRVTNLVRWHMFFSDTDEITHSAVRRLVRNVGKDNVWDLMKIRRADRLGMGRPKEKPYRLRKYMSMIEEVIRDPVSVGKLAIDGDDVIRETNESPGPRIGWILHALLEDVLEDPNTNTKETLTENAKELSELDDAHLKEAGTKGKQEKQAREQEAIQQIKDKYHVK